MSVSCWYAARSPVSVSPCREYVFTPTTSSLRACVRASSCGADVRFHTICDRKSVTRIVAWIDLLPTRSHERIRLSHIELGVTRVSSNVQERWEEEHEQEGVGGAAGRGASASHNLYIMKITCNEYRKRVLRFQQCFWQAVSSLLAKHITAEHCVRTLCRFNKPQVREHF